MRKFFLISILLLVFGLFWDVSAKEIIIDGVSYDDSLDIEGDGFFYNANLKVLYLDGYDGSVIVYRDFLEIRVSNANVINGNGNLVGIDCSEVSIVGSGTLKIINGSIGINCNRVQIQDVMILIKKCNVGIMALKEEVYFYQSKVIIEKCNLGIYGALNMCFNHANVNILDCSIGIRRSDGATLSLNEADLYIKTTDYCLEMIAIVDLLNSRVVLKSDNLAVDEQGITISEENVLYVCNDTVNYLKEEAYQFYPIIKIATKDRIDDLLNDDTGLLIEFSENLVEKEETDDDNVEAGNDGDNQLEEPPSLKDSEIVTSGEYTENEYTFSEYEKVEIINPSTWDEIFFYLIMFGFTILGLGVIGYLWRKCE